MSVDARTGCYRPDFECTPELASRARYILHLTACALAGSEPASAPGGTSWESIFAECERNSISGLTWPAASRRPEPAPELRASWERASQTVLYKRLQMDFERERVFEQMDAAGLAHLPIKGVRLAALYPAPEMRAMADNDVLYGFVEPDPAGGWRVRGETPGERALSTHRATDAMCAIMEARGYKVESRDSGIHETFLREPLFNFEMHRELVPYDMGRQAALYENPWERALPDPAVESAFAFRFSDEDDYVFNTLHAFKHYSHSGCGLRFLADERVMLDAFGVESSDFDWDYVGSRLDALGIRGFEAMLRELARDALGTGALAGPPELSDEQTETAVYLMLCGTYGLVSVDVDRRMHEVGERTGASGLGLKLRYVKERVFPPEEDIRHKHPLAYRHKALRPLLPFYRLFTGITKYRGYLAGELRGLFGRK